RGGLVALAIFLAAALTLCWPMLTGKFLAGPWSDQYLAGYSFRAFAAHFFREHAAIPLWNPYLFGGLPFVGAAHGDIFYPTAALRWILPTDVAMNLGFAGHIVLAGVTMYALLRTLKLGWAAAVTGGLAYELTGIVISLVHPGHDGKLFVSALAPLLFLGIVLAVRDRRFAGYGIIALATGLALQGHPQAAQYLISAAAIWGLYWLLGREGPAGAGRLRVLGLAAVAVALGIGLYAIYALPMVEYVPMSPRAAGGFNTGWEHAISFSLPPEELLGTILPQIDGLVTPTYFGRNGLRLHSEYLGPAMLLLAILGIGGRERQTARLGFGTVGIFFLLIALGGSTPVFRLWYEIVPMSNRLRAPGQAFFLVAMSLAFFAGLGAERLFRGAASLRRLAVAAAVLAVIGLLAAIGALQGVAETIAQGSRSPEAIQAALANSEALRSDGLRLMLVTLAGAGILYAILRRSLAGALALASALLVVLADTWMVGRKYFVFSPPAAVSYADDPITTRIRQAPEPYRVWVPAGALGQLGPYPRSWLMAREVPQLFGYHGNEVRFFDELLGGKEDWQNQTNPNIWGLYAIRYLVLAQRQNVPGFHELLGPVATTPGTSAYLYEADSVPPYARVLAGAAKIPDDQIVSALVDPRFPWDRVVLYSDTTRVDPAPLGGTAPVPSPVAARVAEWRPGRMRLVLTGSSATPQYLVVSENWYQDWHATVDGQAAPVLRGQYALLSVVLPPGAREVVLEFRSSAYRTGRLLSLVSLLGIAGLFAVPLAQR
ncbi:MAG TPA: hypothetical protein VJK71_08725, partial [Gemmatimonadales bacterium]|nr:hypothetical protein [Gemmatimonadales bacterium]